jgi:hypothetical protein
MQVFLYPILIIIILAGCSGNQSGTTASGTKDSSKVKVDSNRDRPSGANRCVPNEGEALLEVGLHAQETSMWCWAASGQMCMSFLGRDVSQCEQANNEFNMSTCCNTPYQLNCIQGGWPEFNKYGFTADVTSNSPLSWEEIKHQVGCLKKPIAFSWHWVGEGGHMMVITGYQLSENEKYLTVLDPLPENIGSQSTILYDSYVKGVDHTHWNDYYNISKK